jgi:hypothetical protein
VIVAHSMGAEYSTQPSASERVPRDLYHWLRRSNDDDKVLDGVRESRHPPEQRGRHIARYGRLTRWQRLQQAK